MHSVNDSVEKVARESYARLKAWLAYQWRDLAAAEDALADALLKALLVWPEQGIPNSPQAWLLTLAKRHLIQKARHDKLRFAPEFSVLFSEASADDITEQLVTKIPDKRLMLMLACAHPAIDERVRMPLMLQVVLGLEAADIASAMLVSPAALAQRLVRAKQKIRATGIGFEEPEARDLPERIDSVLEAIYGAFGLARDVIDGAEARIINLHQEAIYLCGILCDLLPESAEAKGLLALMLFSQARRNAQISHEGDFIPLKSQDTGLWDKTMIQQAEHLLWSAHKLQQPGHFQLEAAIQSAHCHRLFSGTTPWTAIAKLYQQLNLLHPTTGAAVAGAVALSETGDHAVALHQLEGLDKKAVENFQPWWVAKGHILAKMGRTTEAQTALQQAIGLSTQATIKRHLVKQMKELRDK